MADTQAARDKLIEDFNAVIADSEALLRAVAAAGGEKAQAMRADLERTVGDARERLSRIQGAAAAHTRRAAKQTDEYVHENPWQSVAIAAAVAGIAGMVIGLILNRR